MINCNPTIAVGKGGGPIVMGVVGNFNARQQSFDISFWQEKLGLGQLVVALLRPGDSIPYAVSDVIISGSIATWTFSETDTAKSGYGKVFLTYSGADFKDATTDYSCFVAKNSAPIGEVPSDLESWYQNMLDAAAAAKESETAAAGSASAAADSAAAAEAAQQHGPKIGENGNWWIWDAETGEYTDSGSPATDRQLRSVNSYPVSDNLFSGIDRSINGVVFNWEKGKCTAVGTATGAATSNLFWKNNQTMPDGIEPNKKYFIFCKTSNNHLRAQIFCYNGETTLDSLTLANSQYYQIPDGTTGMLIRAQIPSNFIGETFNDTLEFNILSQCDEAALFDAVKAMHYVHPSGSVSLDTANIQRELDQYGVCHLIAGTYTISSLNVPAGGLLDGQGEKTIMQCFTVGNAIRLRTGAHLAGINLVGAEAKITPEETARGYNAIYLSAENISGSIDKGIRTIIENCSITNFKGCGIISTNTGGLVVPVSEITNCYIDQCDIGISLTNVTEFARVTNVSVTHCYFGCINNGGNNNFCNCNFSGNTIGLLMNNSQGQSNNLAHGTFSGCTINHSGNNNGIAIRILGVATGEVFAGMQIHYGGIDIQDSNGIIFAGCSMGRSTPINVENSKAIVFSNCTFNATEQSAITETGNIAFKFLNCYALNGTAFDPFGDSGGGGSGSSVTVDDALSSESTNPVQNKVIKAALDGKGATTAIPASGSVSAAGVLSFANSAGTQLFTVQLPLYAGGVS